MADLLSHFSSYSLHNALVQHQFCPLHLPFEVHLHLPILPLIFSIYQSFHMFLPDLFSIIHTSLRRATFIFEKVNLKTSRFSPVLCLAALKSSWPLWRESTFSTVSRTARSISFDAVQSNSLGTFYHSIFFVFLFLTVSPDPK